MKSFDIPTERKRLEDAAFAITKYVVSQAVSLEVAKMDYVTLHVTDPKDGEIGTFIAPLTAVAKLIADGLRAYRRLDQFEAAGPAGESDTDYVRRALRELDGKCSV